MENNLIQKYKSQALLPSLEEVMGDLDFSKNYSYPNLCIFLAAQKVCTTREFNRARRAGYVKSVLGTVPESAAELVDAIVETYGVSESATHHLGLAWTCPVLGVIQQCDEADLLRETNRINDTVLQSHFSEGSISRAVAYWFVTQRKNDQQRRFANLCLKDQFDWTAFAEVFFEDSRVPRAVQIAAFQKFLWQVKRRLAGLPISNHLMLVIYGNQGKGKSQAVEKITALLGSLVSTGDFQRLGDIREVAMFKSFVVILDEMQKASQADVERVKNVVTRDHFDYRPMHSNSNVSAEQKELARQNCTRG